MMNGSIVQKKLLSMACALVAVAVPALGQNAGASARVPSYDVVAIKPNKSDASMIGIQLSPDRYSAKSVSVKTLIQYAYNIRMEGQISGLPGWADSTRFDVEAKIDEEDVAALKKLPAEQSNEQRRLMMQAMLEGRFRLKAHRETKELAMYALVVAKGGFKLKDADPNDTYPNGIKGPDGVSHAGMMMMHKDTLTAQAVPISRLVGTLGGIVHRIVVDKTGLTGKYDIALRWSTDDMSNEPQDAATTASAPSIFTALDEQLGLKLESTKGPVDTVVVDHIEMPSEN